MSQYRIISESDVLSAQGSTCATRGVFLLSHDVQWCKHPHWKAFCGSCKAHFTVEIIFALNGERINNIRLFRQRKDLEKDKQKQAMSRKVHMCMRLLENRA